MTTAGKAWNDWAGGITGSVLFPSIAWELQNYLSSQSGEAGLTVGSRCASPWTASAGATAR